MISTIISININLRTIADPVFLNVCLSDSVQGRRGSYFQAQALYLSLRTILGNMLF